MAWQKWEGGEGGGGEKRCLGEKVGQRSSPKSTKVGLYPPGLGLGGAVFWAVWGGNKVKLVDVVMERCYRQYTSLNLILIDRFGYLNKKIKEQTKVFLKNSVLCRRDFEKSNL